MSVPCELCGTPAEKVTGEQSDLLRCERCGDFRAPPFGFGSFGNLSKQDKVKLSGWVREQNYFSEVPVLTADRIRTIIASPFPGLLERANRFLTTVVRRRKSLDERFDGTASDLVAATYSRDEQELKYLLRFCADLGWFDDKVVGAVRVQPQGYIRYDELRTKHSASSQGFVAMWFDVALSDALVNGFELGIRKAGYEPFRVDQKEHAGRIDDEIIAQIRRSRFVVADFTGHRGGVYFEAGFAHGLGLPVIWTCRKDDLNNLHFDIRQFNCIDWSASSELAIRLQRRIEAVIGVGPKTLQP